jgi:hypothetical protein
MVFCYQCGRENVRGNRECLECGTKLHVKHHHPHPHGGVVFPESPFSVRRVEVVALLVGLVIAGIGITQWEVWFSRTRDLLVPGLARKPLEEAAPEWFPIADLLTWGLFIIIPVAVIGWLASLNRVPVKRPTALRGEPATAREVPG